MTFNCGQHFLIKDRTLLIFKVSKFEVKFSVNSELAACVVGTIEWVVLDEDAIVVADRDFGTSRDGL